MPEFRVGDQVRVRADGGSTPRTPRYARAQVGRVVQLHGQMENPLDHRGVYPPLFTVAFPVGQRDRLFVDLHADWLEPAS